MQKWVLDMMYGEKRFNSVNYNLKNLFGSKVIKISIDAGLTCPNRDGTLSSKGCIFCGGSGSGDYAFSGRSVTEQFNLYRESIKKKWPDAKYIPYFQAYSNTYGPIEELRRMYYEAIAIEGVVGISIATRPDCLDPEVLKLLKEISTKVMLFVELGFQTSKPETVKLINRCYENEVFDKAVKDLKSIGANVICHVILGLPHESKEDMLRSVRHAVDAGIDGIKLHELFVVKDTALAEMYQNGVFKTLEFDEYIDLAVSALELLPSRIVVHRLTGDAPREQLIAPLYSIKKFHILNAIDKMLEEKSSYQSKFAPTPAL